MKKLTDCLGEVDFSSGDLSAVIIRKDPRELNQQDLKKKDPRSRNVPSS
jgi:hypothetical protein